MASATGALAQQQPHPAPYMTAAATGMSFRLQDLDLASHAVMSNSFAATRANDLFMQDWQFGENGTEPLQLDMDHGTFFFNEIRTPKEIGKSLVLTLGNGRLTTEWGTQALDVAAEAREALPVGNHDLIETIGLELQTTYRRPFVVDFKTVYALGDEHYFGNVFDAKAGGGASLATKTVSAIVLPTNLDKNGRVMLNVVNRTITQPMVQFLARFPNQTADTIKEHVTRVNKSSNEVLLHYSPINNIRPTSCVALWHAAYQPPEGQTKAPLIDDGRGFASMDRELYENLEAQAIREITRHISLGDVTSSNFGIEIRALPVNGSVTPDLGAFQTVYPGMDVNQKVEDAFGNTMTALELFEKTPIEWTGRITTTYRKINDGK